MLLGILHLVLHLVLVDLELDLALFFQFLEDQEGGVIITIVDETAHLIDLLISLHSLLHGVDTQGVVHLLLSSISHLFKVFEIDDCWLHGVGLLLLLLQLHSHQLILHLHELVWDHAKLLILGVVATALRIEHHLHIHIWVNVVHSLTRESHLIIHHHTWELVHLLHAFHVHWSWHLLTHATAWSHFWLLWRTCSWCSSKFVFTMCVLAFISELAVSTFLEMSTQNGLVVWSWG